MIKPDKNDFTSDKILGFDETAKKISQLKEAGKTVGLCHGGFDLLHPGHIKHFESAARLCDYLFVSVTSDRFVTPRKGKGRPIFSEVLRAYAVASLRFVDFVVISDFERATEVIEKLKPSYYIKGPDFIKKTTSGITAERRAIQQAGGQIKYTTDQKFSSTEIINYIQNTVKRDKLLLVVDRDGTLIEDVHFLGKESNWKDQTKLNKHVVDLIAYAHTKCDATKVVVSNQLGVARNYFIQDRVDEINSYVAELLKEKGIQIDSWQYCPDADTEYVANHKGEEFNSNFVKQVTKRKPSPEMVTDALQELNKKLSDFDKVVVIGNSADDEELAKNLNTAFIDVNNKSYDELKVAFDQV